LISKDCKRMPRRQRWSLISSQNVFGVQVFLVGKKEREEE